MATEVTDLRAVSGMIFEVQRFSVHDGPGIRTTVFMKGCPLRCPWCHNPEGVSPKPLLSFTPDRCIGCGYCLRACPRNAHRFVENRHEIDRSICEVCGACAEACYARALELAGREAAAGEIIDIVLRDRTFYETSGGGMTLSGGEPAFQIEFAEALLRLAREAGLHTCIETCGQADYARFARIAPLVDQFLFDVKETDPARHASYTGVSNERILANLRKLYAQGARILLRCPIIPGYNDRAEHLDAVAALAREMPGIAGVEVIPYHPLGESKAQRLGIDVSQRAAAASPDAATVAQWVARLRAQGAHVVNE